MVIKGFKPAICETSMGLQSNNYSVIFSHEFPIKYASFLIQYMVIEVYYHSKLMVFV